MRQIDLPPDDDVAGFAEVIDTVAAAVGDPEHYRRLRTDYTPAAILGGLRALHRSATDGGPDGPAITPDTAVEPKPVHTQVEEKRPAPRPRRNEASIFNFLEAREVGRARQPEFAKRMSDEIAFIAWFKQCDVAALKKIEKENENLTASLSKISPLLEKELCFHDNYDDKFREIYRVFFPQKHVIFSKIEIISLKNKEKRFFIKANNLRAKNNFLKSIGNISNFGSNIKSIESDNEKFIYIAKEIAKLKYPSWKEGSIKTVHSFLRYLKIDKSYGSRSAFERILIETMLELYETADLDRCQDALQAAIEREWPNLPNVRLCSTKKNSADFLRLKECASANAKEKGEELPLGGAATAGDWWERQLKRLKETLEELQAVGTNGLSEESESEDEHYSDLEPEMERLESIDKLVCQLRICGLLDLQRVGDAFGRDLHAFFDIIGLDNLK